jgi:hypothetical protein
MEVDIARELYELAERDGVDQDTKDMAESLADYETTRTERADRYSPDDVHPVDPEWQQLYDLATAEGGRLAKRQKIVICGMARNIAGILPVTFRRLEQICQQFGDYGIVIVENDSEDETKAVLEAYRDADPDHVIVDCRDHGWQHLHGFEAERVQRYATLRNRYREIARDAWPDADVVLCVDLDCWGGWSVPGLLNGLAWLERKKAAGCMASLSLFQHQFFAEGPAWGHYDTWALRLHGWTSRIVAWKSLWLPPAGCEPIRVFSAFGAAALYRPEAFYRCAYESIDGDIEHSGLHRAMAKAGWEIYLNPLSDPSCSGSRRSRMPRGNTTTIDVQTLRMQWSSHSTMASICTYWSISRDQLIRLRDVYSLAKRHDRTSVARASDTQSRREPSGWLLRKRYRWHRQSSDVPQLCEQRGPT